MAQACRWEDGKATPVEMPKRLADGRFEVLGTLGMGGMGLVFEALDHRRNTRVALKTLYHLDPELIYQLKREFRALAELSHPNIITLYELFAEPDQCFFSMELVAGGVDFLSYVRRRTVAPPNQQPWDPDADTVRDAVASRPPARAPATADRVDQVALRACLLQLVDALRALHAAGMVHRDVKPSNVLIGAGGRVVLTDFGIVAQRTSQVAWEGIARAGTPHFVCPEYRDTGAATPACDWYSVGVMLHLALFGRLPGEPDRETAAAPADLVILCDALLSADPAGRPSGPEIARTLGRETALIPEPNVGEELLFGREEQLEALVAAFASIRSGRPGVVHVRGPSGIGKSALVRAFLDGLQACDQAVVLEGRCYERESVPYKALDSLLDAVTTHLAAMPEAEVAGLLPRDVLALARLFPVLRHVRAIAALDADTLADPEPHQQRRLALGALRELLARLARQCTLVLSIDDLQWGDADSAAMIAGLMRSPDVPPLLLLLSYRSEDGRALGPLTALLESHRQDPALDAHVVTVGALSPHDVRGLASTLLAGSGAALASRVTAIALESGGNPYFVRELARHFHDSSGTDESDLTLDAMLRLRVARLDEGTRSLLELVSLSGYPVEIRVLERSAADSVPSGQEPGHWFHVQRERLRAARLLRTHGAAETDRIEPFHDRVRQAVLSQVAAGRARQHHLQLALSLEALGIGDPEQLALHYMGAGRPELARAHAARAAFQAAETLAFDRAVTLFRLALELGSDDSLTLRVGLGHALANAGRSAEAAKAFLAAAEEAPPELAIELVRLGAERFLCSGHLDEGIGALDRVLGSMHLRLAATPRRAMLSLLARRAQLRLRGLSFRERPVEQVPAERLRRFDILWAVSHLAIVDPIRAADFHTLATLAALAAGEPSRVARALAGEASFVALSGVKAQCRAEAIAGRASQLAERIQDPVARGWAAFANGMIAYQTGRFRVARENLELSASVCRSQCRGLQWEVASAELFTVCALYYAGELGEIVHRVPKLVEEAEARGDLWAATNFRTGLSASAWLIAHNLSEARYQVRTAMRRWPQDGFHVQHYWNLLAWAQIDLYAGDGRDAWRRLDICWPALEQSLLLRIQMVRVEATHLRARAALAAAEGQSSLSLRQHLLRQADRDARSLASEDLPAAQALAALVQSALWHERDPTRSTALLAGATERFSALDMPMHAAVARCAHGRLLGGDEGAALLSEGEAWLRAQRVGCPERLCALVAPGFPASEATSPMAGYRSRWS